jgi:N-formylmaleamate deformylase
MAEFSEGIVSANGIRQHTYRAENPGRPSIVMLHGMTESGRCWLAVARALRAQYDLIMVDARSHGKSEVTQGGYSAVERGADLTALVQELALDRPILFGHSMGADAAMAAAGANPDQFRAIILEDPPWRDQNQPQLPPEEINRRAQAFREEMERWQATQTVEARIALARLENPLWAEVELEPFAEAQLTASPIISEIFTAPRHNWRQSLAAANLPVLLITGDPQRGSIVTHETAEEARRIGQNVRVAHIPGTGHCIHRDNFEPVMSAVQQFLDEVAP